MKFKLLFLWVLSFILMTSCTDEQPSEWNLEEWTTPSSAGGASNLFSTEKEAYLSWVEYKDDTTDVLMFSKLESGQWSDARVIAEGTDWFVNWADFPSVVSFKDGEALAAHWLQKSAEGTYDYDVQVSISKDNGKTWAPSFLLHKDGVNAEHGFVTMIPTDNNRIFATWLDGRFTKGESEKSANSHDHGSRGPMTLRSAEFDRDGSIFNSVELDHRVCDCCQTDAALIDGNPMAVYRDRSDKEIRDISIVRHNGNEWYQPKPVYEDNWHIAGCPVNGPAVATEGDQMVVAWFTMSGDALPMVQVSFSGDQGGSFSSPIRVDDGNPLGRVDVAFIAEDKVLVSWVESVEDHAEIKIAEVKLSGLITYSKSIVTTSSKRSSGFPVMVNYKNDLLLTWTDTKGESTVVRSGILKKL